MKESNFIESVKYIETCIQATFLLDQWSKQKLARTSLECHRIGCRIQFLFFVFSYIVMMILKYFIDSHIKLHENMIIVEDRFHGVLPGKDRS